MGETKHFSFAGKYHLISWVSFLYSWNMISKHIMRISPYSSWWKSNNKTTKENKNKRRIPRVSFSTRKIAPPSLFPLSLLSPFGGPLTYRLSQTPLKTYRFSSFLANLDTPKQRKIRTLSFLPRLRRKKTKRLFLFSFFLPTLLSLPDFEPPTFSSIFSSSFIVQVTCKPFWNRAGTLKTASGELLH